MSDNNRYQYDEDELRKFPSFSPNENLKFVVGDLYQAEQELIRYELGEIASINNLLAGSYLKMKSFHEEQIESSLYEEEEFESEFNAYADSNNNQSRQQSRETAKELAAQTVNESEERVRESRRREAFSRNLEIRRKEEEYGFDNRGGGHVVGIKCFVNEVHKVTLLNHNKHLFSTIMLAHPSESYKDYLYKSNLKSDTESVENPVKPLYVQEKLIKDNDSETELILKPLDIGHNNWEKLAFHFGISSEDLPLPPDKKISLVSHASTDSGSQSDVTMAIPTMTFSVPSGYKPYNLKYGRNAVIEAGKNWTTRLHFGNYFKDIKPTEKGEIPLTNLNIIEGNLGEKENNFIIGVSHSKVYDQSTICTLECELPDDSTVFKTWHFLII